MSCIWDWREALPEPGKDLAPLRMALPMVWKEAESEGVRLSWGDEWGVQAVRKGRRLGDWRAWHSCGLG